MSFKAQFNSSKGFQALDTPIKLTRAKGKKFRAYMKNVGVKVVIRYYARKESWKTLTKTEAETLCDEGFRILPVYQDYGRKASNFSASRGRTHADNAQRFVDYIGQPEGTTIFWACDADFKPSEVRNNIVPYFEEIKKKMGDRFRIGVYGSGTVCDILLEKDLIEVPWLTMSRAFHGTKDFFYSGKWAMRQVPPERTVHGVVHDRDVLNWKIDRMGAFKLGEEPKTVDTSSVGDTIAEGVRDFTSWMKDFID